MLTDTAATPPQQAGRLFTFNALHHTHQAMLNVIRNMWAGSTWRMRAALWARLQNFCATHRIASSRDLDFAIPLFAESVRSSTVPATRLRYASDLASIATRLGYQVPITRMYSAGLRHTGALIPQHQAPPMTSDQLTVLQAAAPATRHGNRLLCALFLAWKTCSRFDEVSRIVGRSIVRANQDEIIISWLDRTKATVADPFRPDSYTVIRNVDGNPQMFVDILSNLQPDEPLIRATTQWFDRWLREVLPRTRCTAHSIKAGALNVLAIAVEHGHLEIRMLPLMAKHKHEFIVPSTTLRYIRDEVVKAHIAGTQAATILLLW